MCVCALGTQAQPWVLPCTSAHTHVHAQVGVMGVPMQMAQCVHRANQANCHGPGQAPVSEHTPRQPGICHQPAPNPSHTSASASSPGSGVYPSELRVSIRL